jgi:MFS family permease
MEEATQRVGGPHEGEGVSRAKVIAASLTGAVIEWYDFYIYGTASALVFGQLFFPTFSPVAGTLLAFVTFASGWLTRPLGGVIAGHYGDRVGRKTVLVMTMLVMGVSTFLIGVLPSYAAIGVLAPILLSVLRLVQGIAIGGEWGGAMLLTAEYAPPGKRGMYAAWPQAGVPAGLVLGTGIFSLVSLLPEDQFLAWGWRVPFLISIILVGIGLFIRLSILETPAFRRVQETRTESQMPLAEVVRHHPKNVLLAMVAQFGPNVFFLTFAVYVLSYATQQLELPRSMILFGIMLAALIEIFALPAWGAVSDRVGRRPVFMGALAFLGLYIFPFFWILETGSSVLTWLALVIGLGLAHPAAYGVQASFFAERFEPRIRYSGVSVAYQFSGLIAAAPLPIIATLLVTRAGGEPWLLALYLAAVAFIALVAVYLSAETFRADVDAAPSTEGSRLAARGNEIRE